MASDDKKTKPSSAPKKEPPVKDKSASGADASEAKSADTAVAPVTAKDDEKSAASPSSYSRGEGQKPVSQAYKDNWNAIFAKKNAKKKKR
jgi:hypothetical protein